MFRTPSLVLHWCCIGAALVLRKEADFKQGQLDEQRDP